MDCIILAGGIPTSDDPLYPYTQGKPKALLDIGGRPLIAHVIEAMLASRYVDKIVIVGLDGHDGRGLDMSAAKPIFALPDQGSALGNGLTGIRWVKEHDPSAKAVILSSADVPCLTGPIVDALVESCQPFDHILYYTFVTQTTLEDRFPGSRRTFVPLKGLRVAGGDIYVAQPAIAETNPDLWAAAFNARKHAWKLARIVGPGTLLKFLLRQLSLQDVEKIGLRLLGRPIKVIVSPYAELAMDVDKPNQLELLRTMLSNG